MKWITRERPKIDRIACPWFIDGEAEFISVPTAEVLDRAQEYDAMPYDIPGVELSHEGELCTFNILLRKYDLQEEELYKLGAPILPALPWPRRRRGCGPSPPGFPLT